MAGAVKRARHDGPRAIGPASGLATDLAARLQKEGRPIRIGLVGSGEMGTDIVTQCDQMTGITVAAIAEINIDAAKKALRISGRPPESYVVADSKNVFDAALKGGMTAITNDAQAVCTNDQIDVIIDATGRWPDQDALNLVCAGRWTRLHPRFNAQNSVFAWPEQAQGVFGASAVAEAVADPAVVHFEGPLLCKPWHALSTHPWRDRYREFLRLPWIF